MNNTTRKTLKYSIVKSLLLFTLTQNVFSQSIWIRTDNFKQEFLGVGGTADGFVHTWNAQTEENKRLATKLVAEDIHLNWIKNYPSGNINGTNEYDSFARFANDIQSVNPDVKVQITVNNLPDELEKRNGQGENRKGEVNDNIPDVYQRAGQYYFDVLDAFRQRGVIVDELDLLNEPGGVDDAIRKGRLLSESVDHLRNLINNPNANPNGVIMPKILGPSHWSVDGGKKWIDEWKANLPRAIENLDILTTHGYRQGWSSGSYKALGDSLDLPFYNNEQTGKLQVDDPLTEAGFDDNAPEYISDVSIAGRITEAINGGVDAFFIFNIMNSSGNNAALIRTGRNTVPSKSLIYSGFKQLTSLQPRNSHRVGRVTSAMKGSRVLTMRKKGENRVYLHVTNINAESQNLTIRLSDDGTNDQFIHAAKVWVSDEAFDESVRLEETYSTPLEVFNYSISPYSVNSFEFVFSEDGIVATPEPTPNPTLSPTPGSTPTPDIPTPTPVPGDMLRIEAESAELSGIAEVFDDTAASGGQGVAFLSELDSAMTLSNVPASNYFDVSYASEISGEISILINGEDVGNLPFESTGAWIGSYNTTRFFAKVPADASITIFFDAGDSAMNVDFLEFNRDTSATPSPTPSVSPTAIPTLSPTPGSTVRPTPFPESDWYFIVHKPTDYKIQSCATEDSMPVVSRLNINVGDCVQWRRVVNGDYFHLQSRFSNKYMKPDTNDHGSNISAVPNTWKGNWTQWDFEDRGDGYGHIVNRATGKYIFLAAKLNSNIQQQSSSWRGDFTRWRFEPISPSVELCPEGYNLSGLGRCETVKGCVFPKFEVTYLPGVRPPDGQDNSYFECEDSCPDNGAVSISGPASCSVALP